MSSNSYLNKYGSFFFFLLLLTFICGCTNRPEKYYRLRPLWTRNFPAVQAVDFNNDGIDELVISRGEQIDVQDWKLNYYYMSFKIALSVPYKVQGLAHSTIDSLYFLVNYQRQDSILHKILIPTNKTIGQSVPSEMLRDFLTFVRHPETSPSDFYQSMNLISFFRTLKGNVLGLFYINTGWDRNGKRGILAADIRSQKVEWVYHFGSSLYNVVIEDFDKNGSAEIVVGTYATNNDLVLQGTGDDSSYVFIFEDDGKLNQKLNMGPYWSGACISTGQFGRMEKEIVVYQFNSRNLSYEQNLMRIVEPLSGKVISEKPIGSQMAATNRTIQFCRDFDGDGKDEIVVGNMDGFIRMLDGSLTTVRQSISFNKPIVVVEVNDLDGDGTFEVVGYVRDEKLVVLDNNLNKLCEYSLPISYGTNFDTIHDGKKSHLLLNYKFKEEYQYQMLEFQQSMLPFPTTAVSSANPYLWSLPLALLLCLMVMLYRNRRKRLFELFIVSGSQAGIKDSLLVLDRNRQIRFIGQTWSGILQADPDLCMGQKIESLVQEKRLESLRDVFDELLKGRLTQKDISLRLNTSSPARSYQVSMKYFPLFHFHHIMIFDKSDEIHMKQVKEWAEVAQKLAHGIKTPLTSMKLNAEELRHLLQQKYPDQDTETDEYIQAITEQVGRLKRMSDGFMRFVEFEKSDFHLVDLNERLTELVLEWHTERSPEIRIDWDLGENLQRVLLDEEQFAFAFKNVFFNALESIEGSGTIHISTRYVELLGNRASEGDPSSLIEIQIQDTGVGIPPDHLDKVMQPYFTSKTDGTGLGLSIVQKIMDSHDGELDIQSQQGAGTTVTMRFRTEKGLS